MFQISAQSICAKITSIKRLSQWCMGLVIYMFQLIKYSEFEMRKYDK